MDANVGTGGVACCTAGGKCPALVAHRRVRRRKCWLAADIASMRVYLAVMTMRGSLSMTCLANPTAALVQSIARAALSMRRVDATLFVVTAEVTRVAVTIASIA